MKPLYYSRRITYYTYNIHGMLTRIVRDQKIITYALKGGAS